MFGELGEVRLESFALSSIPDAVTGTAKDFDKNTSMTNGGNYTPNGAPNNTTDVRLTTPAGPALTITTATITAESLSVQNGSSYTISNNTNTSNNSTLALGNSAGFTNVFSGVANDLIFS
jgi:hypothetical protein